MSDDLFIRKGARFSACGKYRYDLFRIWEPEKPYAMFLMLNPSTADETVNDPTVTRCQRYALSWGYGGLHVCNLFAYRVPYPVEMKTVADPVGPENDRSILSIAFCAGVVVCGWGNHGSYLSRSQEVLNLLDISGIPYHALAVTGQNEPGHPLYLKKDLKPEPFVRKVRMQNERSGCGL